MHASDSGTTVQVIAALQCKCCGTSVQNDICTSMQIIVTLSCKLLTFAHILHVLLSLHLGNKITRQVNLKMSLITSPVHGSRHSVRSEGRPKM
uniref:Uncharacterized protein n=1 Tax=Gossypium raimondii TaxID=29730 RepID=A0A0D2UFJ6_GOSRA|nr:hypothetical protein B456_009G033200 [Gossypium raimondii]